MEAYLKLHGLSAIALALMSVSLSTLTAGTVQILEPVEGCVSCSWTLTTAGLPPGPGGNGVFSAGGSAEADNFVYAANRPAVGYQHLVGVLFDDPQLSLPSDIITIDTTQGSPNISINITSDTEVALGFPAGITTRLFEDGTYQLMGTVNFDGSTDSIFLQSDVDAVPEPGALTLLSMGIVALGGYSWRRRKHSKA